MSRLAYIRQYHIFNLDHDRALVVEDLPAVGGLSPEGRSMGGAIVIDEQSIAIVPKVH
jgi:hypothetical protein